MRDLRIYARSDEGEAPQLVHLPDLGSGPEAHGGFLARVTNRIVAKPATGVQLLHALAETLREI